MCREIYENFRGGVLEDVLGYSHCVEIYSNIIAGVFEDYEDVITGVLGDLFRDHDWSAGIFVKISKLVCRKIYEDIIASVSDLF